ncbi:hypothetical protein EIN43_09375 [Enterobacter hormaechei]|uniref:Uncharacterized protein n=1 Tax=Enterobacter hormaechei TaxID=158836 RepID=A0A4Y5ZPF4_9ENTR|nr:hypothetical protein EIN43_09375 [Enterobacter hormaechei]
MQNLIEAPCRVLGLSKDRAMARAEKLLERLRLKPYSDRYPLHLWWSATACGDRPCADDGASGAAVR